MEQQEQRNLLLALVLCFGLFMLYNFFVLDPQQKAAEAARQQAAAERRRTGHLAHAHHPQPR